MLAIKKEKTTFNGDRTSYETRLLVSSRFSGENLVWFSELGKIDEIIMGVRKRSKVNKLLIGSTAQYVILNAPCPVVTIKRHGCTVDSELIWKESNINE